VMHAMVVEMVDANAARHSQEALPAFICGQLEDCRSR
jgi:hypothetical protein